MSDIGSCSRRWNAFSPAHAAAKRLSSFRLCLLVAACTAMLWHCPFGHKRALTTDSNRSDNRGYVDGDSTKVATCAGLAALLLAPCVSVAAWTTVANGGDSSYAVDDTTIVEVAAGSRTAVGKMTFSSLQTHPRKGFSFRAIESYAIYDCTRGQIASQRIRFLSDSGRVVGESSTTRVVFEPATANTGPDFALRHICSFSLAPAAGGNWSATVQKFTASCPSKLPAMLRRYGFEPSKSDVAATCACGKKAFDDVPPPSGSASFESVIDSTLMRCSEPMIRANFKQSLATDMKAKLMLDKGWTEQQFNSSPIALFRACGN